MSKPLPAKMESFCLNWVESGNASDAYKKAGYSMTNPKTISEAASRLLKNSKVVARIAELRSQHIERHKITVDTLVDDLEEDRQTARTLKSPQMSAAVSATMGKAKLLGFLEQEPAPTMNVMNNFIIGENMLEAARRIAFVLSRASGKIITQKKA
jgi:phage terminase small subunit